MNSNLEMIKSTSVSYQVDSVDINETNIYCLTNQSGYKIIIFDHYLSTLEILVKTLLRNNLFIPNIYQTQLSKQSIKTTKFTA